MQGAGDRKHAGGHLHATEHGIIGQQDEIAGQRQLEPAPKGEALDGGQGGDAERLNGAVG